MLRTPEDVLLLIAQLNKEYEVIIDNFKLNEEAWERIKNGADHSLDWAALGYTLHTIYTAMENYFLRISKSFENNISSDARHRDLLEKMQLELPAIRPALLDRVSGRLIDELRGFRHIFRSLYDGRLDSERVKALQKKIPEIKMVFKKAHENFKAGISEILS